jgi:hypothetical protein
MEAALTKSGTAFQGGWSRGRRTVVSGFTGDGDITREFGVAEVGIAG